jgi:hypothetical protein
MDEVEAMEFLLSKLSKFKTNDEFLKSMNAWEWIQYKKLLTSCFLVYLLRVLQNYCKLYNVYVKLKWACFYSSSWGWSPKDLLFWFFNLKRKTWDSSPAAEWQAR